MIQRRISKKSFVEELQFIRRIVTIMETECGKIQRFKILEKVDIKYQRAICG